MGFFTGMNTLRHKDQWEGVSLQTKEFLPLQMKEQADLSVITF